VLDQFHLGHQVCDFDQFFLGVAAGDDDVLVGGAWNAFQPICLPFISAGA
jgi:hypothetical protein